MHDDSRAFLPGAAGALGINAKLRANPDPMGGRVQRFALQAVARGILPGSRTSKCLRLRAFGSDVQVWKSTQYGTTCFAGLQTCGSVWTCPVCAAKIAERRRSELVGAMWRHRAAGGFVSLLTLTTPHQRGDDLAQLLAQQGRALQGFLRDRETREVFAEMGVVGQVRALEVTHGRKANRNNGWHPHFHFLQFHGVRGTAEGRREWAERLHGRWVAYCVRAGLGSPSVEHGLKLDDGSRAAQYVAKGMWGLEDEMTKGHTKKARAGGETPFDLLRAVLVDGSDRQAAALFREFSECFKGKRQLSWSNGLKARLCVEDKTDEQLSVEKEARSALLGLLTVDQWRDVLKVEGRATVLEVAAKSGWPAVQQYLWFIDGARDGVQFEPGQLDEVRRLLISLSP